MTLRWSAVLLCAWLGTRAPASPEQAPAPVIRFIPVPLPQVALPVPVLVPVPVPVPVPIPGPAIYVPVPVQVPVPVPIPTLAMARGAAIEDKASAKPMVFMAAIDEKTSRAAESPSKKKRSGITTHTLQMSFFRLLQASAYRAHKTAFALGANVGGRSNKICHSPFTVTHFKSFVSSLINLYKALDVVHKECFPLLDAVVGAAEAIETQAINVYRDYRPEDWRSKLDQPVDAKNWKTSTINKVLLSEPRGAVETALNVSVWYEDFTPKLIAAFSVSTLGQCIEEQRAHFDTKLQASRESEDLEWFRGHQGDFAHYGKDVVESWPRLTRAQKRLVRRAWRLVRPYMLGPQKRRERNNHDSYHRSTGDLSQYVAFIDDYEFLNTSTVKDAGMRLSFPYFLGSTLWDLLHSIAELVASKPLQQQGALIKEKVLPVLEELSYNYGCPFCLNHFTSRVSHSHTEEWDLYPVEWIMLGWKPPDCKDKAFSLWEAAAPERRLVDSVFHSEHELKVKHGQEEGTEMFAKGLGDCQCAQCFIVGKDGQERRQSSDDRRWYTKDELEFAEGEHAWERAKDWDRKFIEGERAEDTGCFTVAEVLDKYGRNEVLDKWSCTNEPERRMARNGRFYKFDEFFQHKHEWYADVFGPADTESRCKARQQQPDKLADDDLMDHTHGYAGGNLRTTFGNKIKTFFIGPESPGHKLKMFVWKFHNAVSSSIERPEEWYRRHVLHQPPNASPCEQAQLPSRYWPSMAVVAGRATQALFDETDFDRANAKRILGLVTNISRISRRLQRHRADLIEIGTSRSLDRAHLNATAIDFLTSIQEEIRALDASGADADTILSEVYMPDLDTLEDDEPQQHEGRDDCINSPSLHYTQHDLW